MPESGKPMKKRITFIVLLTLAAVIPLGAQCPWKTGEQMEFDIRALGINAAHQWVKVRGITNINGRDAWIIWTEIKSTGIADSIYKLRDTMTTYIDVSNYNTIKYQSKKYEGGWTDETFITNSMPSRLQTSNSQVSNSQVSNIIWYYDRNGLVGAFKTAPPVVDLIGMLYYSRTIPMASGNYYRFNLIDFRKMKPVEARDLGREYRKIGFLDRKNILRLIKLKETGNSDMTIWLTDDTRRLPVQIITMKIMLGSLYLGNLESVLTKYREK
jgi:hypothetical protein